MDTGPQTPDSSQYYDQNASQFIQNTRDADLSVLYTRFLALLPPGAHILDAGCGSGRDSRAFAQLGYRVSAFDASAEMVAHARQWTGLDVVQKRFDEVDEESLYDAIWASASLLHVGRAQIQDCIARLSRALVPGGIFYMSFKWGEGDVFRNGRLFSNYTIETFTSLIQSIRELKLVEVWQSNDVRPGLKHEKWLNALVRKQKI